MLPIDYLLFLQIVFFLCITPGTPRVVIVTYAINYGLRRSAITAFGDISANTIQMIFIAFGIGTIIAANPEILSYAKWIGILYLLYLAFDLRRSSKNINFKKNLSSKSLISPFLHLHTTHQSHPVHDGTLLPFCFSFRRNSLAVTSTAGGLCVAHVLQSWNGIANGNAKHFLS